MVLKPTQGPGFSSFCSTACADSEKNVPFAHSTWLPPRVLASQGTDHDHIWRVCAPLSVEPSLPSLSAAGGLCLEVSLGTSGPDPAFNFLRYRTGGHFRSEEKSSRNGSGSHVSSDTSRHSPPTALKLGSEDSQLKWSMHSPSLVIIYAL